MTLAIPHDAIILVADGKKALFLRNEGDQKSLNLKTEHVFVNPNPSTHEQGTDRPGHSMKGDGTGRRSAMESTDWHDLQERDFARQMAVTLEELVRTQRAKALVIAAPPRTLAELRHALHKDVRAKVILEIDKDLTKHSVADIEKHLVG